MPTMFLEHIEHAERGWMRPVLLSWKSSFCRFAISALIAAATPVLVDPHETHPDFLANPQRSSDDMDGVLRVSK